MIIRRTSKPPLSVDAMLKDSAALSEDQFVRRFADPFLLVEPIHDVDDEQRAFQTIHIRAVDAASQMGDEQEEHEAQLFQVAKQGVVNATLVTIGRGGTSDIQLDSPAISKLHAYFTRDPISGAIALADAGSTNGTVVGGQRLPKDQPLPLSGGEVIELADRFRAVYLPPHHLFNHLMGMRGQSFKRAAP